jgi:tight adherence protein B
MTQGTLAVIGLSMLAAGCLAYVFLYPLLSGEARVQKRQKAFVGEGPVAIRVSRGTVSRRDQVAQTLKEVERREKDRNRVTTEGRIAQAGLTWTKQRFFVISGVAAAIAGLLLYVLVGNIYAALGGMFVAGFGFPRQYLSFRKKRRIKKFTAELPNSIDVIVRGIRAGLPLNDCLRIVAKEVPEPVRSEFKTIVEAQGLGIPLSEAISKLYERVPIPESNFFAIVIGIQSKSGGNLSEALGNLSRVLRERKKMGDKIIAMSMEAKASAAIIASLPFVVALLTYLSSPDYVSLLWTTMVGKLALVVSGFWMLCGILIMKRMISFDF